jgi:hypothetical protein
MTLDTVNNIASVFNSQREYDKALEWHQRALKGLGNAFGNDHPSTLNTSTTSPLYSKAEESTTGR